MAHASPAKPASKGRFRLDTPHHISSESVFLDAGTEVGDGTPYPWPGEPSERMTALDFPAQQRIDALLRKRNKLPGAEPEAPEDPGPGMDRFANADVDPEPPKQPTPPAKGEEPKGGPRAPGPSPVSK